tara:strand:- start:1372 stop:1506 length:135 start_codon:yes stop_codon:yes gene_type:complete
MKALDASGRKEGKAKVKKPRIGATPGPSKPVAAQNQEFDESVQL